MPTETVSTEAGRRKESGRNHPQLFYAPRLCFLLLLGSRFWRLFISLTCGARTLPNTPSISHKRFFLFQAFVWETGRCPLIDHTFVDQWVSSGDTCARLETEVVQRSGPITHRKEENIWARSVNHFPPVGKHFLTLRKVPTGDTIDRETDRLCDVSTRCAVERAPGRNIPSAENSTADGNPFLFNEGKDWEQMSWRISSRHLVPAIFSS